MYIRKINQNGEGNWLEESIISFRMLYLHKKNEQIIYERILPSLNLILQITDDIFFKIQLLTLISFNEP